MAFSQAERGKSTGLVWYRALDEYLYSFDTHFCNEFCEDSRIALCSKQISISIGTLT